MRIAVLLSGAGLTLKALLSARYPESGTQPSFVGVISDRADALGLQVAAQFGVSAYCVARADSPRKAEFEAALAAQLHALRPDLVILAGFMRVLSGEFVAQFPRMLNLHPSLLPKFPGLETHQRALDADEREHGASVHWVTAELDGGPVIAQARCPILDEDSAQSLGARVKQLEQPLLISVLTDLLAHR